MDLRGETHTFQSNPDAGRVEEKTWWVKPVKMVIWADKWKFDPPKMFFLAQHVVLPNIRWGCRQKNMGNEEMSRILLIQVGRMASSRFIQNGEARIVLSTGWKWYEMMSMIDMDLIASGWELGISSAKLYRFAEVNSVISKHIWLTMGADKQQWWASQLENSLFYDQSWSGCDGSAGPVNSRIWA